MDNIFKLFYDKTGISFKEKRDITASKIENFYKDRHFNSIDDFFYELKKDDKLFQEFINRLTVSESYFFRELKQIEIFSEFVKEKHLNRSFKILSLPCANGEEPYTIAMYLIEAGINPTNINIIGVDINSSVIESAKDGFYSMRKFFKTPPEIMDKYFIKSENGYFINDSIKRLIDFKIFNIFSQDIFSLGTFDYIFSRNMLIYFDASSKLLAEEVFYKLLKPDGYLFLGHADNISNSFNLKKHIVNGTLYYQK